MKQFYNESPHAWVTSARVERVGAHDQLAIWIRGARAGALTLSPEEVEHVVELLGLREKRPDSEPAALRPVSWAPRSVDSPFTELALAVQLAERPEIKQWQWRCEHGNVLADHLGSYEPACGCRAPIRGDGFVVKLASQLHAELAAAGVVAPLDPAHVADACPVCAAAATFLRRHASEAR